MLWTLIVLLLLFWLLGFAFDVAGGIIHVSLTISMKPSGHCWRVSRLYDSFRATITSS